MYEYDDSDTLCGAATVWVTFGSSRTLVKSDTNVVISGSSSSSPDTIEDIISGPEEPAEYIRKYNPHFSLLDPY